MYGTLFEQAADVGRADGYSVFYQGLGPDDLHAQFLSVPAIVFKAFAAVVPEAVVVADDKYQDVVMFL